MVVALAALSDQAINRATLDRQLLLERTVRPAAATIEHLVGMQAQAPRAPFVGLWTRLVDFDPAELDELMESRQAVRASLMRGTVHLVTARDCLAMRPTLRPVLDRAHSAGPFRRRIEGVDLDELVAAGRALLDEAPRTRAELGQLLSARWPGRDPTALAHAVGFLVPQVQVPPRGTWTGGGPVRWATNASWLGADADAGPAELTVDDVLLRYLGAFGPATVMDAQAWCGLTRLGEVSTRLGRRLRRFRDSDGRELLDLPSAPRPDPDTPAPPRFLPEYDNLLLSYADRSRVVPDGRGVPLWPGHGGVRGEVLVDGRWAANWEIARAASGAATLTVEPFERLARRDVAAVSAEGVALLAWAAPGSTPDVRVLPPA
ncbi:MAG TPA: winged helix DNA-binding domain-containing protein [Jatrophihabitantaceae bacterium]